MTDVPPEVKISAGTNVGTPYANREAITPRPIIPATTNLGDVMQGSRWASDAVNWFFKEVVGQFIDTGGKDLYDLLITPITGDFNRIRANGDAWNDVGDMFWKIAGNMSENAADLTRSDWTGAAADAFFSQINVVWTGAFLGVQGVCNLIQKVFNAIADVSVKIATKCANMLNDVLARISRLVSKCAPMVGWFGSLVEWAGSGFRDFPYVSDIEDIITIINDVLRLQQTIQTLVDTGQKVYQGLAQAVDAIRQIPTIDTTHQAIDVITGFREGVADARENAGQLNKTEQDLQGQVDNMTKLGGA